MANKTTKKDYFNQVIALATEAGKTELIAFAQAEIERLERTAKKKAEKARETLTKGQENYNALAPVVVAALGDTPKSAKEVADEIGVTPYQKVSPILTKLAKDGVIIAGKGKGGKTVYSKPVAGEV